MKLVFDRGSRTFSVKTYAKKELSDSDKKWVEAFHKTPYHTLAEHDKFEKLYGESPISDLFKPARIPGMMSLGLLSHYDEVEPTIDELLEDNKGEVIWADDKNSRENRKIRKYKLKGGQYAYYYTHYDDRYWLLPMSTLKKLKFIDF